MNKLTEDRYRHSRRIFSPSELAGGKLDIVKSISSLAPTDVEFHIRDQGDDGKIRKASFVGPNTNLEKRLINYDKEKGTFDGIRTPPINDLDKAALVHDIAYGSEDLKVRHEADKVLIKEAQRIYRDPKSTFIQKFNAGLVIVILKGKVKLGIGLGGDFSAVQEVCSPGQGCYSMTPSKIGECVGEQNREMVISLLKLADEIGIPAVLKLVNDDSLAPEYDFEL